MSDAKTLANAVHNTQRALLKLSVFLNHTPYDEVTRAAVLQAFEFSFEALWKLLQKWGYQEGVTVHSPKSALSFGVRRGICDSEVLWLSMLRDRSLIVHTYNEAIAEQIYQQIRTAYAPALLASFAKIVQEVGSELPGDPVQDMS